MTEKSNMRRNATMRDKQTGSHKTTPSIEKKCNKVDLHVKPANNLKLYRDHVCNSVKQTLTMQSIVCINAKLLIEDVPLFRGPMMATASSESAFNHFQLLDKIIKRFGIKCVVSFYE
ncbi:hypothetical protein Tco_1065525, partial [Tanacetum coccineum]